MPTRLLREGILTSERVNSLDRGAELFYRRLMSVVDDYGRYYAHPKLLRAAIYPLLLNEVADEDITTWLKSCVDARLILVYTNSSNGGERHFLELLDFRQQMRAKQSKYPPPTSTCIASATQTRSTPTSPAHLDGDGVGVEVEVGIVDGDGGDGPSHPSRSAFRMSSSFRPSNHFFTLARQANLVVDGAEFNVAVSEFIAYWLTQPKAQNQEGWDHALIRSLRSDLDRRKKTKKTKTENFESKDYGKEIVAL